MKLRKGSRPYIILKYTLTAGGALLLSTVAPVGSAKIAHQIIKNYIRKKRVEKKRFLEDLKRLQERRLIDYHESDDGTISITLTKLGKTYGLRYRLL